MKLYGRNPVLERIKINPKSIKKIYLQENHNDGAYIRKKANKWGIPVFSVPRSKMIKMCRSLNSQGLLAEIDDFAYTDFDILLDSARKKKSCPIFLDDLNDPQNLGAIMRSIACLGGFCLVLPKQKSVAVTEAVLRVSSGGDNFVSVARVGNLGQAIDKAKENGYWIAGAVPEGGKDLMSTEFPYPLALVIGSEHKGIREHIIKRLDLMLTIPMQQARLSFNVAQAATIIAYEIVRQKKKNKSKK